METTQAWIEPTQTMSDFFGLWTTTSAPASPGVAFALPGEEMPDVPIWRADLPEDMEQASSTLAGIEASLHRAQSALTTATDRIDLLVKRQTSPVSFGMEMRDDDLSQSEIDLLYLIQEAQFGKPPVSYGLGDLARGGWEKAVEQFQDFIGQVQRILSQYALVETHIAGQLMVRTSVSWMGDFETAWQVAADAKQMALHKRTLSTALAARSIMFRSVIVVATNASKLSVLLATPGGAILALPAAWKFINQIRAELEKYQKITEEN